MSMHGSWNPKYLVTKKSYVLMLLIYASNIQNRAAFTTKFIPLKFIPCLCMQTMIKFHIHAIFVGTNSPD